MGRHVTQIILDIESRSAVKLNAVPACEYARHRTTSLLCIAWQVVGETEVQSWAPGDNDTTALAELHQAIADGAAVHAWNSPFDCAVWNAVRPDWPPIQLAQQHDVAARAAMCGLPRGLEKAAAALGIDMTKDKKRPERVALPDAAAELVVVWCSGVRRRSEAAGAGAHIR